MTNEQILERLQRLVILNNQLIVAYRIATNLSSYQTSFYESRIFSHLESQTLQLEQLVSEIEDSNDK